MRPLRILHSEAATGFGGQEHHIFNAMCAMRAHGHHLEAVCQPHAELAERLRGEGFIVHTLYMDGPLNYVRGVYRVRKILKTEAFDVLNTHSRRDTLLAGVAARLAGVPLIVRTRHLAIKPTSLLSYTVVPHCVVTVSEYVRQLLLDRGAAPDKVAVVYSPIALPPLLESSTLRTELGLADSDIVVGCVAVMREKKGHRALIDAMEPLLQRPEVHLVLVGDGSPVLENLQTYIAEKNLQSKVHFTGRRTDIPNILAGLDLFALATEQEASGTVFVEAAAAGLPVVGTDVGGVAEMMQNGVTGLLAPLHDQQALTQALCELVNDPQQRQAMGRAGQRFVRESGRFSNDALVADTEACYSRWLGEDAR